MSAPFTLCIPSCSQSINMHNLVRAHCRTCTHEKPCELFELDDGSSVGNTCICGHSKREHALLYLNPVTGRLEGLPETTNSNVVSELPISSVSNSNISSGSSIDGVSSAAVSTLLQALVGGQFGHFMANNSTTSTSSSNSHNNNNNNNNNSNRSSRKRPLSQQQPGLGRRTSSSNAASDRSSVRGSL